TILNSVWMGIAKLQPLTGGAGVVNRGDFPHAERPVVNGGFIDAALEEEVQHTIRRTPPEKYRLGIVTNGFGVGSGNDLDPIDVKRLLLYAGVEGVSHMVPATRRERGGGSKDRPDAGRIAHRAVEESILQPQRIRVAGGGAKGFGEDRSSPKDRIER